MRSGRRTQDYHLIKTQADALFYAADIPSTAWGPLLTEEPRFKLVVLDDNNVSPKTQAEWFARLREKEFFSHPYLILISSDVDDSLSTGIGYDIMKRALSKEIRVQITESSRISTEVVNEETVFMLTNLTDEAPPERIQSARDWCYRHQTCFRLICATGDPASLLRRMKLKFNAAFYLDSRIVVEKTLA